MGDKTRFVDEWNYRTVVKEEAALFFAERPFIKPKLYKQNELT
jgi:hypothetical protein